MRIRVTLSVAAAALVIALAAPGAVGAATGVGSGGGTPGTAENFQLVGHDPLFDRGMNAALALYTDRASGKTYVYLGNRTDGSDTCGVGDPRAGVEPCPHPHPGILIEDVTHPANPTNVGEVGQPYAGNVGITTRELRVWPQKKLLIVMSFRCSSQIHACPSGTDATFPFDIKFFDLADPVHPRFIGSYVTRSKAGVAIKPHEMYLWVDPGDHNRALLWQSTPSTSSDPARPNLVIADISACRAASPGPTRHRSRRRPRCARWRRATGTSSSPAPATRPTTTATSRCTRWRRSRTAIARFWPTCAAGCSCSTRAGSRMAMSSPGRCCH